MAVFRNVRTEVYCDICGEFDWGEEAYKLSIQGKRDRKMKGVIKNG